MKFKLDTTEYDKIELEIHELDEDCELTDIIQEFCFGIASFYMDFALKIGWDTQKAKKLQDICISCINANIEALLEQEILDNLDNSFSDEVDGLIEKLRDNGFSDDEISNIVDLVKSAGSIESVTDLLKKVGEDSGIDMNKELKNLKSNR